MIFRQLIVNKSDYEVKKHEFESPIGYHAPQDYKHTLFTNQKLHET